MNEFHKELLADLVKNWSMVELNLYLAELRDRAREMDKWIRVVEAIRKKQARKPPVDTGVRGGS